jgi:hypothetical protein
MDLRSENKESSNVTSEVLEQLVQHYSQEIHVVQERVPYFDPLSGQSYVELPSVVSFWLYRITQSLSQHDILQLVSGFGAIIRPCLMKQSVGCISVLQHYELLLSQLLSCSQDSVEYKLSASDGRRLSHQINLLVSDITIMTSESKFQCAQYIRCNIVIPTLLRILHHCFTILASQKGNAVFSLDDKTLARCAASLLAFETDRIDPVCTAPMLFRNDYPSFESICACPPKDEKKDHFNKFFTLHSIDWSSISLDGATWNDLVSGVQSRSAEAVWLDIASVSREGDIRATNHSHAVLNSSKEEKRNIRRQVMKSIGMETLSVVVQSHFFGKDEHLWDWDETQLSTYIMMGKQITQPQPVTKEKPYKSLPSRVYVTLAFVCYLVEEDVVSCLELIPNVLPMCLELVDSSNPVHTSLGTCALIRLLGMTSSSDGWSALKEQSLQVLDLAFATSREGRALILIGQAQSRLLNIAGNDGHQRRQVTRKWLTLLRQSADGGGSDFTTWEVLVGGVIPLLYQHSQSANVDVIELGRLGLSALLPLVGRNFVDTKILVASLVGLINLMVGAYPMMVRHGGKIMSHILAATLELKQSDCDETKSPTVLALHTAAVALVIVSGVENSFGEQVLDKIEHNRDTYQENLLEVVAEVRRQAACLSN